MTVSMLERNAAAATAQAIASAVGGIASPTTGTSRRAALATALANAFKHQELAFHYQPQIDLRDGTLAGVEALLRWDSAEFGSVSPAEFVPIAEDFGLIGAIGEWLFRRACEQSVAWDKAGLPLVRISVNVGARELERPDFAQRLESILLSTGANPAHLGIEIAESVLMKDPEHSRQVLRQLHAIGLELALDNFGTSYSNLGVLRSLPLDVLKIDRSLIHDVTAAPEDVSITRAVLMLAQALKLRVLAEGVETEGQVRLLVANGCELMQGYVFSPPVEAAQIERMLQDGRRLSSGLLGAPAKQQTLLIVDDEDNVVSSLRRLLRGAGYRILSAKNGEEGLARMAENDVDVVISDQRMPGMTGVEMLRRAKQLHPDTIRIVLSGYTELTSITDAVNEGAIYKFLTKPWDDERLRAHVAEAFRRKGMSDENRRLATDLRHANQELAKANERQQAMLERNHAQLDLEACRASNTRDLVETLPTSVIGIDTDGVIAFANRQARLLMGPLNALVGCDAVEVLPVEWMPVLTESSGKHARVAIAGARFLLSAMPIADGSLARGRLLSLVPDLEPVQEVVFEGAFS